MKQNKKRGFIILLLLTCIVAVTFAVYAAFTSSSGNFKRVVVARTQDVVERLRFSSNYLSPYQDRNKIGTYPISVSSDSDVTIGITVCNYPQDAQSDAWANDKDITYTIEWNIFDNEFNKIGNSSVTMTPAEGTTLQGGQKSVQLHTITIPKDAVQEISKGYIQIIVTPDDNSLAATGSNILAANLQIIPASTTETAWTGVFGDNNVEFSALDAYNYQISGTEQCTLTLTWDETKVRLSEWSIKTLLPNTTNISSIKNSITFSVGGQDQPTSYMLQFYKVGTGQPENFKELGIELTQNK